MEQLSCISPDLSGCIFPVTAELEKAGNGLRVDVSAGMCRSINKANWLRKGDSQVSWLYWMFKIMDPFMTVISLNKDGDKLAKVIAWK